MNPSASAAIQLACSLCGYRSEALLNDETCPGCGEAARTRSLAPFVEHELRPLLRERSAATGRLLAFAMTAPEKRLLAPLFDDIVSVSLFGDYGDGGPHLQGVDMRDLSRYPAGGFAAVFGILIFDYFIEMRQAMDEVFRVLEPGGVLFTMISPQRLTRGWEPPAVMKYIESQPGYFSYLPPGTSLISAVVGRRWFVRELRRAGFRPRHVAIGDGLTTAENDWFIGRKPNLAGLKPRLPSALRALTGSRRV